MALKGESFPEEGFKFMWGTCYGTTTYLGHALSALLFHFSLLLNTSMFVTIVKVFLLGPKAARKGRLRRPLLLWILYDSNYSTWFYVLYHLDNLLRVCVDGKASKGGGIKGFKDKIPRCAPMLFISLQRKDENWCNSKLHNIQVFKGSVAGDFLPIRSCTGRWFRIWFYFRLWGSLKFADIDSVLCRSAYSLCTANYSWLILL